MSKLISISDGNTKLGSIPNISLLPGTDCGNCTLCIKDCYAMKPVRMYPKTRAAWAKNSNLAKTDRVEYFKAILAWITLNQPEFFRWHVGGDILDQDYLEWMHIVARSSPSTKFLCFTKMYHLDFSRLPSNLVVVASMWPGLKSHKNIEHLPKAWMQDGTETRVPEDAIPCPGLCEDCGMCWSLPRLGVDVVFKRH